MKKLHVNLVFSLSVMTFFLFNNLSALELASNTILLTQISKPAVTQSKASVPTSKLNISMACLIAAPQRPSDIKATTLEYSDRVIIGNYEVDCAASYNVYRAEYSLDKEVDFTKFSLIGNTTSMQYIDFVDSNVTWLYYIKAVNTKGESYASNVVEGVTSIEIKENIDVIAAPENLKLDDNESNITLSWNTMQDDKTYMIYRDRTGESSVEFQALTEWPGIENGFFLDANLTSGVNYHYYVVAVINAQEGEKNYISRYMLPELAEQTFEILGTFSSHTFDGVDEAFHWVFTTSTGISYQLQGQASSDNDVFGWKEIENISIPTPQWYMLKIGTLQFDWILAATDMDNKQVYKLSGVSETGGFTYSDKLDVNYTLKGNTLHFVAP